MVDFFVQVDRKVRRLSEHELRSQLAKSKFSGLELMRREDEVQWRPLHETRIFREEVPHEGNPVDAARWRVVRGFAGHFAAYLAVNIITEWAAPIFLFWGIAIVTHGAKAIPQFLALKREGKVPFLSGSQRPMLQPQPARLQAPPGTPPHHGAASGRPHVPTAPQPAVSSGLPAPPPIDPGDTAPTGVASPDWTGGSTLGGAPPPSPYDPTVGLPGGMPEPPTHRNVDDQQLRASVRSKLFGDGSSQPIHIGRYRLIDRLGAGGMGVVYRAHDETLDRPVAVKLVRTDNDVARGAERLQREARAIARLSHPNVVVVHDVGIYDGSVFVAMEFIDGLTLRGWLEQPRPIGDILSVLIQAAQGMAAAHAAGLVHRDFKPENVMVGHDARVRVLDFGLAKPADAAEGYDTLTRSGTMLGTPRYMAPEQFRGEPADMRSDQFAFGVVCYEAIYGVHPYQPNDDRPLPRAVMAGDVRETPVRADVPAAIRTAILRAVAHDPSDRFETITAFVEALGPLPTSSDELASVAAAVRRLLGRRTDERSKTLLGTLDAIESVLAELDAKTALLSSQISQREIESLQEQQRTAQQQLQSSEDTQERDLLKQQLRSVGQRLEGIDRAKQSLQRLRMRRQVAENHLKQLHLDLSRVQASDADLPDLTEPLQELRFEVDAAQEVEDLLEHRARALTSS